MTTIDAAGSPSAEPLPWWSSALVRRIAAIVFVCILAIEIAILCFSYFSQRERLLQQIEDTGAPLAYALGAMDDARSKDFLQSLNLLRTSHGLIGAARHNAENQLNAQLGDPPPMLELAATLNGSSSVRNHDDTLNVVDVIWRVPHPEGTWRLVGLRFDASTIAQALRDYTWRIVGLVMIISGFVTIGTMLTLGPLLLRPLANLTSLLRLSAQKRLSAADFNAKSLERKDEIGEFFRAVRDMNEEIARGQRETESLARFPSENPHPVMRVTPNGNVLFANETAKSIQTFFADIEKTFLCNELRQSVRQALHEDTLHQTEHLCEGRSFAVTVTPCADAGYLNIYANDVTKQLRAENELNAVARGLEEMVAERTKELITARDEAQAANRTKSEFLATMSHEIRTPMNGILGMTRLLQTGGLDSEHQRFADAAVESGEALLALLNDILDLSKMDAQMLEFEEIPFSLPDLVEGSIDLLAPKAHAKGLELGCLVAPALQDWFIGDALRVRQVLVNLLGNAVKFTAAGTIAVHVSDLSERDDRVLMEFSVRDTGIGIGADVQEAVFEEFTQADASTTRSFGGTGLGLTICKRIIDLYGGRIGVDSIAGEGSTFWFELELPRSKEIAQPAVATPPATLRDVRALVIDDTEMNRAICSEHLRQWGLQVECVECVDTATHALREAATNGNAFELLVVDHHMPKGDGFDLIRSVREDTNIADTRIVLLSSDLKAEDRAKARALGVAALEQRPVRTARMLELLSTALAPQIETPKPQDKKPTNRPVTSTSSRSLHILVVDDNPTNQLVALATLKRMGHTVQSAQNGKESVAAVREGDFDLVFMDIQMPVMDGVTATKQIRQLPSDNANVPIVAMTANVLPNVEQQYLAAGMNDYIAKPVIEERLAAVLQRFSCENLQTEPSA